MKVYIGADHRGYKLKEKLKGWLIGKYDINDMGATSFNPDDDYTIYAEKVSLLVADQKGTKGILLCGSGVGVDIVANKFDGIRASIGKSPDQVKAGCADDDMNILVIAADYTKENEAKNMVKLFLNTKYQGQARHKRRLEDIKRIEKNN